MQTHDAIGLTTFEPERDDELAFEVLHDDRLQTDDEPIVSGESVTDASAELGEYGAYYEH